MIAYFGATRIWDRPVLGQLGRPTGRPAIGSLNDRGFGFTDVRLLWETLRLASSGTKGAQHRGEVRHWGNQNF